MAMIKKTALILEHGLFQPIAHRLAKDYERVLYFRPWVSSFPKPNDFYIGTGYNDIERVESYEQFFDEDDVTWVFPDLHFAPLQKWLREQGKPVWGAGNGEDLELLRGETKELMKEIGLPLKRWGRAVGMDELRDVLKDNKNVFVKVSTLRGLTETFCSPSYDLVRPKLDALQSDLGGRADVQEFIIEEPVDDAVEVGYDGYNIDGQFPSTALYGVEEKDQAYAGAVKPYSSLPKEVVEVNKKLSQPLKKHGYRGFFSTEIRVGKDKKPYLIDLTCRHASPAGESILEITSNLGEIIESGAHGKLVDMKVSGKFACQLMLCSDFARCHWLPVKISKDIREHVHLYHSCMIEGQEYVVPMDEDMPQIGSVTASGNTPEEAMKRCSQYASKIEAFGLKYDEDALTSAIEDLKKA